MANMAYCRWNNTYLDMLDCFEAFYNEEEMSESEIRSAKYMIHAMCDFLMDNGVIEEWDSTLLEEHLNSMAECDQ